MNGIIIDPYMFELKDETEIINNLGFFSGICQLLKDNNKYLFAYKGLIDKIALRSIVPFPIYLDQISSENLKERIKSINDLFSSLLIKKIVSVDVDICKGDQNYIINSDSPEIIDLINNDDLYFELCSILIQKCFNSDMSFDSTICSGYKVKGLQIDDSFILSCSCVYHTYNNFFNVVSIYGYLNEIDKAFLELVNLADEKKFSYVNSPEIVKGDHHNKIQFSSKLNSYDDLSPKNRPVINLLRYFGLTKVVFERFEPMKINPIGSISVINVTEYDNCDMVKGWFYAETEFRLIVKLYFPKRVGKLLSVYLNNDFSYNIIERLIDSIL